MRSDEGPVMPGGSHHRAIELADQKLAAFYEAAHKLIVRREGPEYFDLDRDPDEREATRMTLADFEAVCRHDALPVPSIDTAMAHPRRWEAAAAHGRGTTMPIAVNTRGPQRTQWAYRRPTEVQL